LAVPTGIVTAEMTVQRQQQASSPPPDDLPADAAACPQCQGGGHARWARFCLHCGSALPSSGIPR
jgi:hypothetical protein